jgi:membrane protein
MIKGLMVRSALHGSWEFCVAMVQRFREERAMQTAGSLTFTTLLSLAPLFAVVLAAATAFPVFDQAIASLQQFIVDNVLPDTPGIDTVTEQINSFSRNAGRLTAIGLAGFVVTSLMLMLTIDNAMNRIFRVQRRRSTLQIIFVYWAVLSLGPVLIGGSLSLSSFALGLLQLDAPASSVLRALPLAFTCAALTMLYGIVPARRVELRHALAGGILAGIGFELAKRGFASYLAHVPDYTLIYGAFATVPIFLVWLYLSWLVVLAGAIFTAMLPAYYAKPERHRVPGEQLAEALGVLAVLARAHGEGHVMPLNRIARQVRLQPYRCEEVLERAAALGWAARTDGEGWVLARDADAISVQDVYREFVFDGGAIGIGEAELGLSLRQYSGREKP